MMRAMRRRTTTALGAALSLAVIASGAGAGAGAAFATIDVADPSALTVTTNPSIAAPVLESAAHEALTLSWPSPAPDALAALQGGVATDTHLLLYPADAILPGDPDAAADAIAPSPLAELDPTPGVPAASPGAPDAPDTSPFTIVDATLERPLASGETAVSIGGLQASTSYRIVTRFLGTSASADAAVGTPAVGTPAVGTTALDSVATAATSTLAEPERPAEPEPSSESSTPTPNPAQASPTPSPSADPTPSNDFASQRSAIAAAAAPGVPDAPNATPLSDSAITVSWPAVSSGAPVRFYVIDVYRGGDRVKTVPNLDPLLVGTTYDVTGLAAHTAYTFTITAQGTDASSAPSAPSEAVSTLRGAPGAPSKPVVAASATDPLGIDASWTAPASDGGYALTGYRLELFAGTTINLSNLVATTEVGADTTTHAFGRVGLVGSSLSVRVTALNGAGETSSPLSASVRVEATAVPSTRVAQPKLTELGPGRLGAEWTAATGATASTGYLATIATTEGLSSSAIVGVVDLGTGFDQSGTLTATLPDQPGGRAYTVQITAYERIDAQTKRYRVTSLKSAAVQTSGASAPQRADRPTTLTSDGVDRLTVAGAGIANGRANGSPVTTFELTLYRAGSSTAVGKTQVPAVTNPDDPDRMLQTAYTFTGLDRSTTYTVTAAAVNAAGTGPASTSSAAVTTLAKAIPGSVPPAITTLAALRTAMADGSVRMVTAEEAGIGRTVEPTSMLSGTFPWKGSATSGEVWLYEPLTYLGQFSVKDGVLTTTVRIGEVDDGDYALSFVPDGQAAKGATGDIADRAEADRIAAVPFTVAANRSGPTTIDNAVLRWGFSHEAGNGAFFGGCNFLTAGRIPDIGHGEVLTPDRYSAQSGPVSIEKPGASGTYELARYETRCTDRNGKPVDSNVNSPFTDAQLVIVGGAGTVDPSTNSGTIQWKGDFSVAFYGGLTFWYGSDPKLTVENGVGTLTATASGYGTDMDDLSKWVPIPPREIVLGTLHGVTMRSDGFTVSPDYVGVKIAQGEQVARDGTNGSYWGSFPQSFVDFQQLTGQFSYWFTSGGRQDPGKVAAPLTVGFDAATFVAVPPAQSGDGSMPSLVPNAKQPPRSLKAPAPLPPPAAAAAGVGGTIYETVTVVQEGQVVPASQVVPLFLALLVLLGGVTVVAAAGGGLIASGLIPMGRR